MEAKPRPWLVEPETTNAIGVVLRPRQHQDFEGLGPSHDKERSILRSRQDLDFKGLRPSQEPEQDGVKTKRGQDPANTKWVPKSRLHNKRWNMQTRGTPKTDLTNITFPCFTFQHDPFLVQACGSLRCFCLSIETIIKYSLYQTTIQCVSLLLQSLYKFQSSLSLRWDQVQMWSTARWDETLKKCLWDQVNEKRETGWTKTGAKKEKQRKKWTNTQMCCSRRNDSNEGEKAINRMNDTGRDIGKEEKGSKTEKQAIELGRENVQVNFRVTLWSEDGNKRAVTPPRLPVEPFEWITGLHQDTRWPA